MAWLLCAGTMLGIFQYIRQIQIKCFFVVLFLLEEQNSTQVNYDWHKEIKFCYS